MLLSALLACAALPVAAGAQSKVAGSNWQKGPRHRQRAGRGEVGGRHVPQRSRCKSDSSHLRRRAGGPREPALHRQRQRGPALHRSRAARRSRPGEEHHYYDGLGTLPLLLRRDQRRERHPARGPLLTTMPDRRSSSITTSASCRGRAMPAGSPGLPVRDPRGAFLAGCRRARRITSAPALSSAADQSRALACASRRCSPSSLTIAAARLQRRPRRARRRRHRSSARGAPRSSSAPAPSRASRTWSSCTCSTRAAPSPSLPTTTALRPCRPRTVRGAPSRPRSSRRSTSSTSPRPSPPGGVQDRRRDGCRSGRGIFTERITLAADGKSFTSVDHV